MLSVFREIQSAESSLCYSDREQCQKPCGFYRMPVTGNVEPWCQFCSRATRSIVEETGMLEVGVSKRRYGNRSPGTHSSQALHKVSQRIQGTTS